MKKIMTLAAVMAVTLSAGAQTPEFFEPYKTIDLRLPSVPIFVNDPYVSFWSPCDELNAGNTCHWTDDEKPIDGMLRVDGVTYRFMGVEREYVLDQTLLPMADEEAWEAKATTKKQTGTGWTAPDFDDSSWEIKKGAFGTAKEYPHVNTPWEDANSDVYVRRTVNLKASDIAKDLYVVFSHDDVFELYINGHRVVSTGETWLQGETTRLTDTMKGYLKEGENVIAAHCHNTTGGAYLDYGLFVNSKTENPDIKKAVQKSVDVLATNTYYTFECGPVMLDVVFTAPMLIDNLDLLSTPINYISYQVRSNDGKEHDVQFYLATSPELAVNTSNQATLSSLKSENGIKYICAGTTEQPVLAKGSDGICIDWGFVYLPQINGTVSLASTLEVESVFANEGKLPRTKISVASTKQSKNPTLAFTYDFGKIKTGSNFAMIGYDEVWDIEYMNQRYKGYWARNGKTIYQAFEELRDNYTDIMKRCRELDKRIYDDAFASGDKMYAEILSGTYRHCIAAHKLFEGPNGNLYFFSKENNSGGFVNTVDLTYPESPIFFLYNPELQKAMMRSIFEYCRSDRWNFPFAAHDLGIYPHANGQRYSITSPDADGGFAGNMPLEESGNMITLCAMISMLDGNTSFADQYWDTVKQWADYLAENGQDPENQLCTDDFAGHLAHNANLSVKAIMGVAGFAEMARMKGDIETADKYMAKAREMAEIWEKDARDGDHYGLTLDKTGTWSQKYNMVWDKLWGLNLFPNNAMKREMAYYPRKQNTYGLPLDSRSDQSKTDWIMWTAAMADTDEDFQRFLAPLYKYINETPSRVPVCDYYNTKTATRINFKARSVVGGHWMKVLMDNFDKNKVPSTGITSAVTDKDFEPMSYYNMSGVKLSSPAKGLNIVTDKEGDAKKIVME